MDLISTTIAGVSWAAWLFVISVALTSAGIWIMLRDNKMNRYGDGGYGSESKMWHFGFYLFVTALCSTLVFFFAALAVRSEDGPEATKAAAQVAPSRLAEGVLVGLDPVRVNVQAPDGSRGAVIIYGRRNEEAFTPVAYRARFWNLADSPEFASWELSLATDRSGLATVEPKGTIRADGRWQEGRTTPGSFATSDTAQVVVEIGDEANWVYVPVAL